MHPVGNVEKSIVDFLDVCKSKESVQKQLNEITEISQLNDLVSQLGPKLNGSAIIPLQQATSPAKIVVDSGVLSVNIPWRILRCPGGPLVLQMICRNVSFALWIESC